MRYVVIIEKGEHNLSAYVPDLPGCVSTGRTTDEVLQNIREAIREWLAAAEDEKSIFSITEEVSL